MPRPEPFTEAARQRRLKRRRQQGQDPTRDDEALRELIRDLAGLRVADIRVATLASELRLVLINVEMERRRSLGVVNSTPDQMKVTIEAGAKHARKLRVWSHELPAALLHHITVLIPGDPPLRAVIDHLAETFDRLSEIYPQSRRGQPPGRRDASQSAAVPIMLFTFRHALDPQKTQQQRREFVRECLAWIGIECPDPNNHPAEFDRWFRPVEKAAALAVARSRARALAQSHPPE